MTEKITREEIERLMTCRECISFAKMQAIFTLYQNSY